MTIFRFKLPVPILALLSASCGQSSGPQISAAEWGKDYPRATEQTSTEDEIKSVGIQDAMDRMNSVTSLADKGPRVHLEEYQREYRLQEAERKIEDLERQQMMPDAERRIEAAK